MKAHLKPFLLFLVGLLSLIGLGSCILAVVAAFSYPFHGIYSYMGKDCEKSLVYGYLPLPPQKVETVELLEGEVAQLPFPMVVERHQLNRDSGIIIFRADEAWQEAFRQFYPAAPVRDAWMADAAASDDSADFEDHRLHYFVKYRRWELFHSGYIRNSRFSAMRDESGQYLLIRIWTR